MAEIAEASASGFQASARGNEAGKIMMSFSNKERQTGVPASPAQ
jgi:hypothetical protein